MTDPELDALHEMNRQAKGWSGDESAAYRSVWRLIARASKKPKPDTEVRPTLPQIMAAASGLAYQFVMLEEVTTRVIRQVEQAARMKRSVGGLPVLPEIATTTSSTMVSDWRSFAPEPKPSLTAYRAYLEWALLLARKINLVISNTEPGLGGDDVLACDLLGDPNYSLKPLRSELLRRINKRAAHQTYFEDPDGPDWPIPEIQAWASKRLEQLMSDLNVRNSDIGEAFESHVEQYRREVADFG